MLHARGRAMGRPPAAAVAGVHRAPDKGGSGSKSAAPSRSSRQLPPVAAGLDGDSEQEATSWPAPPAMGPFKQVLPLMREDGPSLRHTSAWWKMQQGHRAGHAAEGAPSKWAGQIFVKRAGFRTTVLEVTSDDSVASVKARFKWFNARLLRHSRELWDDTRSLGSYGVRKEDTLQLCGRLCGGMGKPTVVLPGEDSATPSSSQGEPATEPPLAEAAQEEQARATTSGDAPVPASTQEPAAPAKEEDQAAKAEAKPADERKPAETSPALPAPTADVKEPGVAATSVAAANQVAQRHAKLCMDASGLIRKGVFGGIALFDGTLEDQVGHMDASALRAIYAEHVLSADAKTAFSPPNNPTIRCTPEGELFYVVGTDGIDTEKCELKPDTCPAHYEDCMVQGRNDTPLSKLLVAEEVKRAGLRDTEVIALRLYSGNFLHATAS